MLLSELLDGLTTCDDLLAHHQTDSHSKPLQNLKAIVCAYLSEVYGVQSEDIQKVDGLYILAVTPAVSVEQSELPADDRDEVDAGHMTVADGESADASTEVDVTGYTPDVVALVSDSASAVLADDIANTRQHTRRGKGNK